MKYVGDNATIKMPFLCQILGGNNVNNCNCNCNWLQLQVLQDRNLLQMHITIWAACSLTDTRATKRRVFSFINFDSRVSRISVACNMQHTTCTMQHASYPVQHDQCPKRKKNWTLDRGRLATIYPFHGLSQMQPKINQKYGKYEFRVSAPSGCILSSISTLSTLTTNSLATVRFGSVRFWNRCNDFSFAPWLLLPFRR